MRGITKQLLKVKGEETVRVKVVAKVASMMSLGSQKAKARTQMFKEIVHGKNGIKIKTDRHWRTKRENFKLLVLCQEKISFNKSWLLLEGIVLKHKIVFVPSCAKSECYHIRHFPCYTSPSIDGDSSFSELKDVMEN